MIRSTVPPGTVDELVNPVLDDVLGLPGSGFGTAMCPEFLREGSGVSDFFAPPFTVVGTQHQSVADAMTELLGFLDVPVKVVATRTAEALKYSCNAFHAAKVSFTNELARVFRPLGIDSREVMEIFCTDTQLNIAPSYLRPGFAFGGPCLGKDLRELLHLARMNGVELPLLSGTMSSNEMTVSVWSTASPRGHAGRRQGRLLGLSFKVMSDDLERARTSRSPRRSSGKGYELRIHDPVVKPSQLIGTNRQFVESRLPHLQQFLSDTAAPGAAGGGARSRLLLRPGRHRGAREQPSAQDHRPGWPARSQRSKSSTATRASGGKRSRERACLRNRPEPAGPFRPTGLARVPGAAFRRATTYRSSARKAPATPTTKS